MAKVKKNVFIRLLLGTYNIITVPVDDLWLHYLKKDKKKKSHWLFAILKVPLGIILWLILIFIQIPIAMALEHLGFSIGAEKHTLPKTTAGKFFSIIYRSLQIIVMLGVLISFAMIIIHITNGK